jgi:predicted RNase H-like HicB family nuclease
LQLGGVKAFGEPAGDFRLELASFSAPALLLPRSAQAHEDAWHAYCPALVSQGGATWGATKEEALKHIEEVVKMVVESLIEHGEPVPETPAGEVQVSTEPRVAVTI